MKSKRRNELLHDHQMTEEPDGGFCVSRVNPMFIDDNDHAIDMKLNLDKDLTGSPTIFNSRQRSNSSGYGSSNHSEGIYNDDFKDSPVPSNNATLCGPPVQNSDQNPINLIPPYPVNSRPQSRWTETFRNDSEYYHKNALIESNYNDSTIGEKYINIENSKNIQVNNSESPKPLPRQNLPHLKLSRTDSKGAVYTPDGQEIIYQNSRNFNPHSRFGNQNYEYENSSYRKSSFSQNSKVSSDSFIRAREMYPYPKNPGSRYRRESRASSLSSGSVTSSSGQGTLSTIPEGKLLTEEYQYIGDVLHRRNNVEKDPSEILDNANRDNFELLKDNTEVQSDHHNFAIPRPVWPPMDRIILSRRKYDGWDSDSNSTRHTDNLLVSNPTPFDSNSVFSDIRKNSNFEIDLNLDPRFHNENNSGDETTRDAISDCQEINGKCRCDASKMLVKLSQVIESILLEAHSPRSALLTIRHELLAHIRNHDCSAITEDVKPDEVTSKDTSGVTSDDIYKLRDINDVTTDFSIKSDDTKDSCQTGDKVLPRADLREQNDVDLSGNDVTVNFSTVHQSKDGLQNCEDAMRRLSICLRSDRKLLAVTRAFGETDYTLNFENDIFNTKNLGDQQMNANSVDQSGGQNSKESAYVNVKCDAVQSKSSEFVNKNKETSDNAKVELWERDNTRIIGKETQAHREKPSIWQLYYMQNSKNNQIKEDFSSKLKAKHIPYFPSGGRPEADFTLDMPRQELLSKKLRTSKKQRCMCRTFAWFLCLIVFLSTVIIVSLILTRGRRIFGSMV